MHVSGVLTDEEVGYYQPSAQLELLKKLTQFSQGQNPIGILTGAIGSGKTTFSRSLQSKCGIQSQLLLSFCQIDFQKLLARHLPEGNTFEIQQKLTSEALLQILNETTQPLIIILDNADLLAIDQLQTLLLAFCQQAVCKCRLLLIGGKNLLIRVTDLMQKNALANKLCTFQLKPLSIHETKHYLKKVVGPSLPGEKQILGKRCSENIYALSEGYMGRINRIVRQLLTEFERKDPPIYHETRMRASWVDLMLTSGIVVLLAIVTVRIWMLLSLETVPAHLLAIKQSIKPPVVIIFDEVETLSYIASIKNLPEIRLKQSAAQKITLPTPASNNLE